MGCGQILDVESGENQTLGPEFTEETLLQRFPKLKAGERDPPDWNCRIDLLLILLTVDAETKSTSRERESTCSCCQGSNQVPISHLSLIFEAFKSESVCGDMNAQPRFYFRTSGSRWQQRHRWVILRYLSFSKRGKSGLEVVKSKTESRFLVWTLNSRWVSNPPWSRLANDMMLERLAKHGFYCVFFPRVFKGWMFSSYSPSNILSHGRCQTSPRTSERVQNGVESGSRWGLESSLAKYFITNSGPSMGESGRTWA